MASVPTPAAAASDGQLWANGAVNVKLSDKWRLSEEMTARWSDNRHGLYEIESNTLLGYRLNKSVTVWGGYTHDPNMPAATSPSWSTGARAGDSRRLRPARPGQVQRARAVRAALAGRVDGTGWRLRPYLKYSLPIAGKTALNLSTEPFFNLNTTSFQKSRGSTGSATWSRFRPR